MATGAENDDLYDHLGLLAGERVITHAQGVGELVK
jgi:hypothetical protein